MWQCAIQSPGFVTSRRMSTVSPVRTSTVSFQTRFGSGTSSRARIEEATGPVDVEGMGHRVVRVHLVDEADLHLITDAEAPVDRGVLRACRAVDELPAHVGGSGDPVDLDHVVFPLDPLRGVMLMRAFVVLVLVPALVVLVPVVMAAFWYQVTSARASCRTSGNDPVHRSSPRGASGRRTSSLLGAVARSFIPHFGHEPGSSLTTSGCMGHA